MPNIVTYLNQRIYSSATWSENIYQKGMCLKKIKPHVPNMSPNMLIILHSIVNILGGGEPIWPFDKLKNLNFGNESNIHIWSFEFFKESGYGFHSKNVSHLSY